MSQDHITEAQGSFPEHTDELTSLHNRAWLNERLAGYDSQPEAFALVMVDIDGLKQTNDNEGHMAGDQLLTDTAIILQDSLRQHDNEERSHDELSYAATRLGGDEFVLLLPGVNTQEQVESIIARAQENLRVKGIEASFGGRPRHASERAFDLLAAVDSQMYDQKAARKAEHIAALPRRRRLAYQAAQQLIRYSGVQGRR